jgi:hypothetical protein
MAAALVAGAVVAGLMRACGHLWWERWLGLRYYSVCGALDGWLVSLGVEAGPARTVASAIWVLAVGAVCAAVSAAQSRSAHRSRALVETRAEAPSPDLRCALAFTWGWVAVNWW